MHGQTLRALYSVKMSANESKKERADQRGETQFGWDLCARPRDVEDAGNYESFVGREMVIVEHGRQRVSAE